MDPNLRQEASNAKLDAKLPGIKIFEESLNQRMQRDQEISLIVASDQKC